MLRLARHEELIVEDPIVLVGNLQPDDVGVLGRIHEKDVLGRVVQVAGVVHVDMIAARIPSFRLQVDHASQLGR